MVQYSEPGQYTSIANITINTFNKDLIYLMGDKHDKQTAQDSFSCRLVWL